ncbi:MAG: DUF2279 domain-containing protein [Flavobacteriales bacterium]|nr:DUF2279 domain-containing protein [Flavobacteriales bacterium]
MSACKGPFFKVPPAPVVIGSWLIGLLPLATSAQSLDTVAVAKSHVPLGVVAGGSALVIGGTLIALDQAWYQQYERVPFHTFNDGDEWLQMDKVGHAFSTYTVGRWGKGLLDLAGVDRRVSTWVGGSVGFLYLTGVEYLDGRSAAWGFSWWDMAANAAGTGLFIGQELGWREQRIRLKYASHLTAYAEQNPDLLGSTTPQRILKDYNGATYWLSVNPSSFAHRKGPWSWLNVAFGYGADGMVHATPTPEDLALYGAPFRQYYLSLDIDLERIPTRSKALRTAFFLLNCIKVPSPTLEYQSNGQWVGHWLYF